MYILYIDGSGSVQSPSEQYFILGGVSIFERQIYHLIRHLDDYVTSLGLGPPEDIELHASVIANGSKRPWKGISRKRRLEIIDGALDVFMEKGSDRTRLFAIAVDKQFRAPQDPVEYAFEEICNRFNLQLTRIYHRSQQPKVDAQRGLVVMDKSSYESALQNLAGKFRLSGTRWGDLRNMAEVPLFVDSQASRLVQLADLVSWAVWRRYERRDTRYFDRISTRFDSEGGVMHGLVHFIPGHEACTCPACYSRLLRDRLEK